MDKFKYIVFDEDGLPEFGIIFPSYIQHDRMARMIGAKPITAGFVKIQSGKIVCFGSSISLKLMSDPEDNFYFKDL